MAFADGSLGEREVKVGGEGSTRAAVLYEASGVAQFHLKRPEAALHLVEHGLRVQPHHIGALVRTAAGRGELQRHADAARTLQQLAQTRIVVDHQDVR